jgi:hypothetical protein
MGVLSGAAKDRSPGKLLLPVLVGVLLLPAALGSSQTIFNDGDVSWHIASGRWIIQHGAVPTTDPFSFTWAGKPWVAMEWLADVLHATAFDLAGYSGIAALVTAAMMALNAIVFFNAGRWGRYPLLTLVALDVVLVPMMLARPHVLVWPIIACWTALLMRAREHGRAPPLWAALVMTLWANLHASFAMGLLIAGVFGLEALAASPDRLRALRQWLIFGVACAAAVCINANGLHGVLYPLSFTDLKMLPLIDEWKPSNPHVTPFFFGILAFTLALIAWKRPRLHPVRWFLLGALLAAALFQARHQAVLAIVSAMVLPEGFAKGAIQPAAEDRRAACALALAGALVLLAVRAVMPISPPDSETNPWKLIAAVPPELRSKPVLNNYSMGGPLILSGIRPYVDGRGDMYGDELVLGYGRIADGDAQEFAAAVRRWDIRWAIAPHRSKAFIAMLDRTPGWRRIRQDQVGVIYVRA